MAEFNPAHFFRPVDSPNYLEALKGGYDLGHKFSRSLAHQSAGDALASGEDGKPNMQGAINVLAKAGDFDTANAMMGRQNETARLGHDAQRLGLDSEKWNVDKQMKFTDFMSNAIEGAKGPNGQVDPNKYRIALELGEKITGTSLADERFRNPANAGLFKNHLEQAKLKIMQQNAANAASSAEIARAQLTRPDVKVGTDGSITEIAQPYSRGQWGQATVNTVRPPNPPNIGTADLGPDHARVFYNPKTGDEVGRLTGPQANKTQNKFDEAAAGLQAKRFDDLVTHATGQKQVTSQLGTLRELSDNIGAPGVGNTIARTMGPGLRNVGIEVGNLADMEAFTAIVSKMVPAQRPPNSGTMSDKDVMLFKESLPSFASTVQGRKFILDQIEAINQYDLTIGTIASKAMRGEITRNQAEQTINELPDPMTMFKRATGQGNSAASPTPNQMRQPAQSPRATAPQRQVNPRTGEVVELQGNQWVTVVPPHSSAGGMPSVIPPAPGGR